MVGIDSERIGIVGVFRGGRNLGSSSDSLDGVGFELAAWSSLWAKQYRLTPRYDV